MDAITGLDHLRVIQREFVALVQIELRVLCRKFTVNLAIPVNEDVPQLEVRECRFDDGTVKLKVELCPQRSYQLGRASLVL